MVLDASWLLFDGQGVAPHCEKGVIFHARGLQLQNNGGKKGKKEKKIRRRRRKKKRKREETMYL